jgi:tRNA pseudouridine38-40 synthase
MKRPPLPEAELPPFPPEHTGPDRVKIRLIVAYDGTAYQGWQTQKIGIGVQQKLEEALAKVFPSKPQVHGSSRTDTGVHALGMVAHFELERAEFRMEPRKLLLAVNAWLPEDVRILSATRATGTFHARFDATAKQYRYYIWNHPAMNPLLRTTAWHVPRPLNLRAMREAARAFVGTHDFQSFTANPGYTKATTVRNLTQCDIRKSGNLLTVYLQGNAFLYRMCRGIVGTIVQVGAGRFRPDDIGPMLRQRDRRVGGMTAPAHGLVLHKVFYPRRANSARSAST